MNDSVSENVEVKYNSKVYKPRNTFSKSNFNLRQIKTYDEKLNSKVKFFFN